VVDVDIVIVAIGRTPNPIIQSVTKGLEVTTRGTIIGDQQTGKTSLEGVYTGGDIMTGEATVISAMGSGKRAAKAIHKFLLTKDGELSKPLILSCQIADKTEVKKK
jgi:glutamate synthase (NADPH/NADH) small chain